MVFTPPKQYEVAKKHYETGKIGLAITSASEEDIIKSSHIVAYREVGTTTWKELKKDGN